LDNEKKTAKNKNKPIRILYITAGATLQRATAAVQHEPANDGTAYHEEMAVSIERDGRGVAQLIKNDLGAIYPRPMRTCCIFANYYLNTKHPDPSDANAGPDPCNDKTIDGIVFNGIRDDGPPTEFLMKLSDDMTRYVSNDAMIPFAYQVHAEAQESGLGVAGNDVDFAFAGYNNVVDAFANDLDRSLRFLSNNFDIVVATHNMQEALEYEYGNKLSAGVFLGALAI